MKLLYYQLIYLHLIWGFGVLGYVDLWQRLDAVVSTGGHQIDWRWVRGHAGDPGNERADALANKGVEMALANGRVDPQR